MVAGFALLAWPAAYGETGVMSFLVGNDGVVREADLGPDTDARAHATEAFDPGPFWQPTEDWCGARGGEAISPGRLRLGRPWTEPITSGSRP